MRRNAKRQARHASDAASGMRRWLRLVGIVSLLGLHSIFLWSGIVLARSFVEFRDKAAGLGAILFLVPIGMAWLCASVAVMRARRRAAESSDHALTRLGKWLGMAALGCLMWSRLVVIPERLDFSGAWIPSRVNVTRGTLALLEQDLRRFRRLHGRRPAELGELKELRDMEYVDPFSALPWSQGACFKAVRYIEQPDGRVLLYSLGPDYDDDKGEKEYTDDLFRYSPHSAPWRYVPFVGPWLLKVTGEERKFDGDIIREVWFED